MRAGQGAGECIGQAAQPGWPKGPHVLHHPLNWRSGAPTPRGLRQLAQGREKRATLGKSHKAKPTPKWVVATFCRCQIPSSFDRDDGLSPGLKAHHSSAWGKAPPRLPRNRFPPTPSAENARHPDNGNERLPESNYDPHPRPLASPPEMPTRNPQRPANIAPTKHPVPQFPH